MAAARSTSTRRTSKTAAEAKKVSAAVEETAAVEHVEGQTALVVEGENAPVVDEAPKTVVDEATNSVADEAPASDDAETPVDRAALLAQYANPTSVPDVAVEDAPTPVVEDTGKVIKVEGEEQITVQCVFDLFIFQHGNERFQAYKGDKITHSPQALERGISIGALVVVD